MTEPKGIRFNVDLTGVPPSAFMPAFLIRAVIESLTRQTRRRLGGSIHHGGVIVRATDVRRHRYLAAHGLPHSPTMAAVHIGLGK